MMRILFATVLIFCSAAIGAQESVDGQRSADVESVGPAENCVRAGDSPQATDGDAGPSGESEADGLQGVPCEEPAPSLASDVSEAGPAAAVEENPAIEASAGEVFKPGDEIPEDYPVPLPSDI